MARKNFSRGLTADNTVIYTITLLNGHKKTKLCTVCKSQQCQNIAFIRIEKNISDKNNGLRLASIMCEDQCTHKALRKYINTVLPFYKRS